MFGLYTYRVRLVVYVSLLLAFLLGVLSFSYYTSRAVIRQEAERNLARVAQQVESRLALEARDLFQRAKMVRDNSALIEYAYVVLTLGTDDGSIRELYQRQFGWLPVTRVVLLGKDGRPLLGKEHRDLIDRVHASGNAPGEEYFYFRGEAGLEIVAIAPLRYRSQPLGTVAITHAIDRAWLDAARHDTGGHLFVVNNGKITLSASNADLVGAAFDTSSGTTVLAGEGHLVRAIALPPTSDPTLPKLWLALPDTELTHHLTQQRNLVLGLAVTGGIAILLVGFMLLRNFSAPLSRLLTVMQVVSEGRFPEIPEARARDEFGFVLNRFAAMVESLREKQEEIRRVHNQLEEQATTDALTGFYNRRYLYELYPKLWSEALRSGKHLAVLIVDLDHFKQINDTHGHMVGDEVLRCFAAKIKDCCRVSDFIFRLGGEEFMVLTTGDLEGATVQAEKIRAAVEQMSVGHEGQTISVTVSIGVSQAEQNDGINSLTAVLTRADRALYTAKYTGRNRVAVSSPALDARAG